jgi:hypothetical protein
MNYLAAPGGRSVRRGRAAGVRWNINGSDIFFLTFFQIIPLFVTGYLLLFISIMDEDIRWKQRFQNYKKALVTMKNAMELVATRELLE